ncbi:zinc finger protein 425-like [Diaphorina citri]|uniref:Zinc finger protein 425-like n=1 Tax=Diaphorina citri TaxID=121845 RepID=A0A3Q0JD38_DIACI|nr:zinc finger protein 425-like [Diaphorina citri]
MLLQLVNSPTESHRQVCMRQCFINWSAVQQNHAGMFICDVCGKEYKYKNGIYRHKKFECGQEPKYQCPQCPYRAKQKSSLKTHISIKHSDSITNGYYIHYGFNIWPLVQQYSKGFECQVCGKRYKYKRGLHRHKQDECGQEPKYQCPQCPYRAKQKSSLKSHMKIRHGF